MRNLFLCRNYLGIIYFCPLREVRYKPIITRRALNRVQTYADHSITFNSMFALCDAVTLTFDLLT